MKKALIVGATGFGGIGLIDIISRHPGLEIAGLVALTTEKKSLTYIRILRGFVISLYALQMKCK